MRLFLHTILLMLLFLCLVIPSAAAESLTTGISSAAATTENPPYNASVFLDDAKSAVSERNWTTALLLTTRGLAYYPNDPDLLCLQAYTYRKMGYYQKSIDLVSRAIPLDPKPVRYANRGYGYLALKNYSGALADAETGILKDPGYAPSYGVKALALHGLGRESEALEAANTLLALVPENAHAWDVKGLALAANGDCAGAAAALNKSLEINPAYDLPYPGFAGAQERLATLSATCMPASAPGRTASPAPTKSPLGWVAVCGVLGATGLFVMRK